MNQNVLNADIFLLAAGFGKRLGPLTEKTPKPLIPVAGKPIIDWNLQMIAKAGFERVIINLHYLGNLIKAHVGDGSKWGLKVSFVEEDPILDTGGGIKNIEDYLHHPYLITVNSDIMVGPDFSLRALLSCHAKRNSKITLVLRRDAQASKYGVVGISEGGQIVSFLGKYYCPKELEVERLMYLGVQVLSRDILDLMPKKGEPFSITRDFYPNILSKGVEFSSFIYNGYWNDIGTGERLEAANAEVRQIFSIP